MTAWEGSLETRPEGFQGEVAGLGLADVIQLNVHNRFSGCITFQYRESKGAVFFRDGQLLHAEQGEREGEDAFYAIVAWPAGRFDVQPNVTTTRCTLRKTCEHLLLEAHRLMDEQRAGRGGSAPPPGDAASGRRTGSGELVERLRRIPGVGGAVLQGKDGTRARDDDHEADALAGQAAFLMMAGTRLGEALQSGDLQRAAVHGTAQHLLLLANRSHHLGLLVHAEADVGAVEAEVKKALARGR